MLYFYTKIPTVKNQGEEKKSAKFGKAKIFA